MSEYKNKLSCLQYSSNPFLRNNDIIEFYDDNRDEQADNAESFINLTQSTLNKNVYELYKSFFYRYQDYNQINR
jgi:hypothetical protein